MVIGFVVAAIASVATPVAVSGDVCRDLLAPPATTADHRPASAEDLLRLRDFGPADVSTGRPPALAVSPDGNRIALVLRRADPAANRYCVALVVVAAGGSGKASVLDNGDDLVRLPNLNRGMNNGRSGWIAPITPRWSPDGRWIAMVKNVGGVPQVWRVASDGASSMALTHFPDGVDDFAWAADGRGIVVSHQPGKAAAEAAIETEGKSGFLFDERTWVIASVRPSPPAALATSVDVVFADGRARPATPDERALLAVLPAGAPATALRAAVAADGRRLAYVEAYGPAYLPSTRLRIVIDGHDVACRWAACGSLNAGLWWSRSGALTWLRTEDDASRGQMALYRWGPGHGAPRRLLLTNDLIMGCVPLANDRVACSREGSTQPRRVVEIDLKAGSSRLLFDPNPSFAHLRLGMAQRLTWTDRYGISSFGDLVLPPNHRPGQLHPLIVVQYDSRGFLRGGTGDEYPIQLFAAHGFAVLSPNKSTTKSGIAPAADPVAYQHVAIPGSNYRRRALALTEAGVAAAIATGTIDRTRMGITGLSDGVLTACFALIHTHLFRVAALSSGCEEPVTSFAEVGPAYYDDLVRWSYPFPDRDPTGFWNDNALSRNLDALATPILVQTADDELRLSLETFAVAREHNCPFELFTFPDEHHEKWQPAHRAAIYQRNLDWFDFWLRGVVRPDPAAAPQFARWKAFRAARDPITANSGPMPRRPPTPAGEGGTPAALR